MEKLMELLNEYRKEKGERSLNEFEVSQTLYSLNYLRLFIKWLVENDKIDLLQLDNRIALSEFNKVERVLMALSISDTPIEDLLLYLK